MSKGKSQSGPELEIIAMQVTESKVAENSLVHEPSEL